MPYFVFAIDRTTNHVVDEAESESVANGERFAEAIRKSVEHDRNIRIVEVCAVNRDVALEVDARQPISA